MNFILSSAVLCLLNVNSATLSAHSHSINQWTNPNPPALDSGTTYKDERSEYEINGDQRFVFRSLPKNHVVIDVYIRNKLLFSVADISVRYDNEEWAPGDIENSYAFYLSSDERTFIVVRGLFENVNVVYVYGRSNHNMMLLRRGARLDNILINEFSIRQHIRLSRLSNGMRYFKFIRWLGDDEAVYLMTACNWWYGHATPTRESAEYTWYGILDTKTLTTLRYYRVKTPDVYKLYLEVIEQNAR